MDLDGVNGCVGQASPGSDGAGGSSCVATVPLRAQEDEKAVWLERARQAYASRGYAADAVALAQMLLLVNSLQDDPQEAARLDIESWS